ncbi:hypothetical protein WME94_43575 [Sorangium sp. So ce429]
MAPPGERPVDDLLTPTLQDGGEGPSASGERPFRLQSQIWLGVLGGVLPMFIIGMVNAGRLRLPADQRRQMLHAGLAALAVVLVIWVWAIASTADQGSSSSPTFRRGIRLANQVLGGLLFLAYRRMQQLADRRFQFAGGEHASLWLPGIAAIAAGIALQLVVLTALFSLIRS